MYKLLFAEDETAAREGILASINWTALNIGEVRAVRNGALANEIAQEWIPDILLTDIRMPRMNGIELSYKIRELNPDCSILIISGYSEVDYLKSAIKLKAIDFVDKPLQLSVLNEQLKNAVNEQENLMKRQVHTLQNISNKFTRGESAPEQLCEMLHELGCQITPTDVCTSLYMQLLPTDRSMLGQYICIEEYYHAIWQKLHAEHLIFSGRIANDYSIYLQLYTAGKNRLSIEPARISSELNTLWQEYFHHDDIQLHICAGPVVPIDRYTHSFQQMQLQIHNIFTHTEEYFHYSDIPVTLTPLSDIVPAKYLLNDLSAYVANRNLEAISDVLKKLTSILKEHYNVSKASIILPYSRLLFSQISGVHGNSTTDETIFNELSECISIEDANRCFYDYIANEYRQNAGSDDANIVSIAEEILHIVHDQYSRHDLSLDDISRQIHRSPSYICVKFKEDTGKTLTQYINEYRIESSLALLREPENKINTIAATVGFDNGNYYTKIFKRLKNMTPAEFREQSHSTDSD